MLLQVPHLFPAAFFGERAGEGFRLDLYPGITPHNPQDPKGSLTFQVPQFLHLYTSDKYYPPYTGS